MPAQPSGGSADPLKSEHRVVELFSPGRICLFGEHSDWAGTYRKLNPYVVAGRALCSGTQEGIYARARYHPSLLRLTSTGNDGVRQSFDCPMEPELLIARAEEGNFWSYACGVAYELSVHFSVAGLELDNYRTTLPIRKGLSSSAAWCVVIARAFNQVYGLQLSTRGEMDLAYRGEICTPSQCGRLDQCCAFGSQLVSMTFNGDRLQTEAVQLHLPIHLVIVDLKRAKDTTRILTDLRKAYPVAKDNTEEGVHMLLGPLNEKVVDEALYILTNDEAYRQETSAPAAAAAASSAAPPPLPSPSRKPSSPPSRPPPHSEPELVPQRLGALMRQSQRHWDSLGRPQCPSELTAPMLHRVLAYEPIQPLIWGGKGIGSQGDGTCQLVCRSVQAQQDVIRILEKDLGVECMTLNLGPQEKQSGESSSS